jgi:putative DNA primase/helicase
MTRQLHPEAGALGEAGRTAIATEIEAEAAEALARWTDAQLDAPLRPTTELQRLLDLCHRLDRRIDDIKEAETAAEVGRLARLTPAAYDRCKRDKAVQLGIDVRTLNKLVDRARLEDAGAEAPAVVPWPTPVDGPTLLSELASAVRRYVVMGEHEAHAVALWVMHCWALDAFTISPRLAVRSATMRSGKTTLRDVLLHLVPKPLSSDNMSVATIFRAADRGQPTLLLDEIDGWLKRDPQIRALINSGHRRGGFVLRTIYGKATRFQTFAPMMLAGIGRLAGTIEDRAVQIVLRRRRPDEPCERFRHDRTDHQDDLARQAGRWAADHLPALGAAEPAVPASLDDRAADNWRPMLAIADAAGPEWGRLAREAAEALAQIGVEEAIDERLIRDIGTILTSRKVDRIASEALAAGLAELEGSPWAEWRGSRPLSKHQLARLLRPFGIQPATIRIGKRTIKGYHRAQFDDAVSRYAPPYAPDSSPRNSEVNEVQTPAATLARRPSVTR